MMNNNQKHNYPSNELMKGFTLIELTFAMVITLIILGIAVMTFSSALSSRSRESSKTDAITSAQAAINIMSREIGNSGYGLKDNGLVIEKSPGVPESNNQLIHFRTNTNNKNSVTTDPGEDVTFYFDEDSESVVRYDANTKITSGIINRVSEVNFIYYDYDPITKAPSSGAATPSANTGRITIELKVILADVQGQPTNQSVQITSDVTLRNAFYNLSQY